MTWFLALAQGHKVQKLNLVVETSRVEISCNLNFKVYFNVYFAWLFLVLSQKVEYVVVGSLARFEPKLSSTASLKWTEVGFIYTFSKILSIPFTFLSSSKFTSSSYIHSGLELWFREKKKFMAYDLHPVLIPYLVSQNSWKSKKF